MESFARLNGETRALYLALSKGPGHTLASLAAEVGMAESTVVIELRRLEAQGLVVPADGPLGVRAASPAIQLGPALAEAEHDLRSQLSDLTVARAELESLLADYDRARDPEVVIKLDSLEETRSRLEELAGMARFECVSLNPGAAQPPDAQAASKPLNQLALERGVAIQCIYQDAFRNDPSTLAQADWLVDLGGEMRTLPVIPLQLVIVDREVALLPLDPKDHRRGAVEVRSPGLVVAMSTLFDHLWAEAVPFHHERRRPEAALAATEREILQLLGRGLTDEAVSRRLGVSVRTVRRLIAGLCGQLGASSRFAAGARAQERGWLD